MLLFAICLILILAVAIVAIPKDVRELLSENCRDARGRLKPTYVLSELNAVAEFYGRFLFFAAIIAVVVVFAFVMVDGFVIEDEFIVRAIGQFDLDPSVWKENLHNVGAEFLNRFQAEKQGSREEGVELLRFLWNAIPVVLLLSFVALILCLRMTSKTYDIAVDELVEKAVLRNKRRITEHYLRNSAQFRPSRRHRRHRRGRPRKRTRTGRRTED